MPACQLRRKAILFHLITWFVALWLILPRLAYSQVAPTSIQAYRAIDLIPALELESVGLLANMNPSTTLEEILTKHQGAFVSIPVGQVIQDPHWERSLWLRLVFRPASGQTHERLSAKTLLEIPLPYLDNISLYAPLADNTGSWQVQEAGDAIPASKWSLPGQFPRFALPSLAEVLASPGQRMVLYMHVPHRVPASLHLHVLSASMLMDEIQWDMLLLGLTFGAMILAALISAALVLLHRDRIFVWYFFFALSALMACLSHSGIAFQLLWPYAGLWPSTALMSFMLLAAASQMQFSKLLFMSNYKASWPVWTCELLGVANLAVAMVFPWVEKSHWISVLFLSQALVFASMAMTMALVVSALNRGNHLALAMMLTIAPLFVTVILGLLDAQAILPLKDMGFNAPIYAAALQVTLLGLCLQWFARERHGQLERERALASTDPLTGFSDAASFQKALELEWSKQQDSRGKLCIVYVQMVDRNPSESMLKRSVRILRTVSQEGDTVARLDERTLALLLPNMGLSNDLSERLSRIVALGLIPERSDPQARILRFRVGVATKDDNAQTPHQLQADLKNFMNDGDAWNKKSIRYFKPRKTSVRQRFVDSDSLDKLWEKALDAEIRASQLSQQLRQDAKH